MSHRNSIRSVAVVAAALAVLAACGEKADNAGDAKSTRAASNVDHAAIAQAAVNHPERPAADKENDAARKPAEALEFMLIEPGMDVFEVEAGGGWFTELLSRAVGPDGSVVMQNPPGILVFVGEAIMTRLDGGRLQNVSQSLTSFDKLDAEDASIDLATWILGPHELYFTPDDGAFLGDDAGAFAEIYRILKPGGVFVVIDHSAEEGSPPSTGHDLHRIDKAIVLTLAADAGFVVEEESDFLANPGDARVLSVFDPAIRGQTDQFAIRFRKPE